MSNERPMILADPPATARFASDRPAARAPGEPAPWCRAMLAGLPAIERPVLRPGLY